MKKTFDDEDLDYDLYLKKLDAETIEIKNKYLNEFNNNAERYFDEIERKKKKTYLEKIKYVNFILKNSDEVYEKSDLLQYELIDIINIYNEIKESKKSLISKFFKFIFNVE